MNNILNLFRMDYYLLKNYKLNLLYVLLVANIIGYFTSLGAMIMVIITFSAYFLTTLFVVEEKYNIAKLHSVLPIDKRDIVLGRYLLSFSVLMLLSLLSIILYSINSLIIEGKVGNSNDWLIFNGSLILASVFICVQFPFYFKFDHSKVSIVAILPYVFVFAIGVPAVQKVMRNANSYTWFINFFETLQNNLALTFIFVLMGCILLFIVSCLISIKLYNIQK